MNVLLVSSIHDREMALRLEGALRAAGHGAAAFYPDAGSPPALPDSVHKLALLSDYIILLVSRHTGGAPWLDRLAPEQLAPLCAASAHVLLLVFDAGIPPASLACMPCLFLLDAQTLPVLLERLVESLALVHSLLPADIEVLRYGLVDLEAFFETAQGLAFAYTGLASAWDELSVRLTPDDQDLPVELALFHRFAANIGEGVTFHSRERLEKRVHDQPGSEGLLDTILRDYQVLEQEWLELNGRYSDTAGLQDAILRARTRAAAFINLLFLVMTLQLLPYCEQYLHMQGLKQLQDMHRLAAQPPDPAGARLVFLTDLFGERGLAGNPS